MMKFMLEGADPGYEVTTVGTAAEALEISARDPFDLYVLDIWLPGMDGLSLCRRIRERGAKAPIILFSAMVRPADQDYALAAGANEFLIKPNDVDRFTVTVACLLDTNA